MNLLAAKLYDPGTAVNKVTTAALAMTALDTTNLRNAFVVPPSGMVRVRMGAVLHGATTFPSILLGVLEGSTVKGRVAPIQSLGNTAVATALVGVEADFIVTGLTPGAALNWDAAYGVETLIASTGLKYGGPNNTTANDAFGAFFFEIWDPCPLYTPTSGTAPTSTAHVKLDTIDDFLDTEVGAIKTTTDKFVFTTANKVDATIQAAADLAQAAADKVWGTTTRTITGTGAAALSAASFAAGAIDAVALDTTAINEIADGLLDRDMASGTDSGSPTVRTVRQALRMLRNLVGVVAGTLTVTKEDDTTVSWTATVTTAAGNPISSIDPAS